MKVNLHKNEINLVLVDLNNLELLRLLRNRPVIQNILVNKKILTEGEQKEWFENLNHNSNFYFLVFIKDDLKGYTLLKSIDFIQKRAEPGIFLFDELLWNSTLGSILTVSFLDFCQDFFGIEYFFGNVLNSNKRALENYSFFDTHILKSERLNEINLNACKTYSEMTKVNRLRKYMESLEDYQRKFEIFTEKSNSLLLDKLPSNITLHNI